MHPHVGVTFGCLALLLSAALSGCSSHAEPTRESSAAVATGNLPVAGAAVHAPNATVANQTARALSIHAVYVDYQMTAAGAGCAQPPYGCLHMGGSVNFTGDMRGQAAYIAHDLPPDPATPQRFLHYEKNPFTFTGAIDGCGSGSLAFTVVGFFAVDAEGMQVNETLRYVNGSATTGFSGIVDAVLSIDTHDYPNAVPISGTVWCT